MDRLDKYQINKLLPHREPMLLIDELYNIKKLTSATGVVIVKKDSIFVQGHFPGQPVMPGVLIVEAFGQTASEATSCGTPVIGFNNSGLSDIISHNKTGYLVKPYDIDQMSNYILNLINDEEKKSIFKKESIKKAKEKWSFEVVSRKYLNLYKKVLKY